MRWRREGGEEPSAGRAVEGLAREWGDGEGTCQRGFKAFAGDFDVEEIGG